MLAVFWTVGSMLVLGQVSLLEAGAKQINYWSNIVSDISGGYNPSLLDAMRFSITVSNICAMKNSENYKPLTYREAFFMATMGGAQG